MDKFKQICRLCLSPCWNGERSIGDEPTRSQLKIVFKFKIDSDSSLPNTICSECSSKVDEFHTFHETVRANQDQLKAVVPQEEEDDKVLVQVEIKGEPSDGEEESIPKEETQKKEIKIESDDDDDDAGNEGEEVPADEPESPESENCDNKDNDNGDSRKSTRLTKDDLKIESFYNALQCGACSEGFETFNQLRKHSRQVHEARWSIKCCDQIFNKKYLIVDHIDLHLNPNSFYCEICSKPYKNRLCLDAHIQLYHNDTEEKPFECDQCGKRFPKEHMLKSHLVTHVRVECTICNRVMANSQNLKVHMARIHDATRKLGPGHVCDICGKKFHSKSGLVQHTNQHKGIVTERVQCPVCNKSMNNKSYLNYHMKNAHSDTNLQVTCDICFQTCRNRRVLANHKRNIHVERTFGCEVCGKMFRVARHLKEHRATHTGEYLYSCSLCEAKTNNNGNIHTHIKNKHPEEYAQAKARGEVLHVTREQEKANV